MRNRLSKHLEVEAEARQFRPVVGPCGLSLLLRAPARPIRLMLDLARPLQGPFAVLYVLAERALTHPPARYQSPFPISRRKVEEFFERFEPFLEQDGRHAVWIMTGDCADRIIYDRHQLLFAYGAVEEFQRVLAADGYGPARISTQAPACRGARADLDPELERLMEWWPWTPSPLWVGDDL